MIWAAQFCTPTDKNDNLKIIGSFIKWSHDGEPKFHLHIKEWFACLDWCEIWFLLLSATIYFCHCSFWHMLTTFRLRIANSYADNMHVECFNSHHQSSECIDRAIWLFQKLQTYGDVINRWLVGTDVDSPLNAIESCLSRQSKSRCVEIAMEPLKACSGLSNRRCVARVQSSSSTPTAKKCAEDRISR